MPSSHSTSVLPGSTVATVVVGCVLLAAWFVPSQKELVHRLDHDGQIQRLKKLAEDRLAEAAPTMPAPQTDREKLHAWLTSADPTLLEDAAMQADRKSLCAQTNTPADLGAELFEHANALSPDLLGNLADCLVRRSLALNLPGDAAELLKGWFARHPSWPVAVREIEAWRWAVRPEEALKALDLALAAKLEDAKPADVEDLRVTLALESNQPNLAFDIVVRSYGAASDEEKPAVLRRLVDLADAGDRTTEASHLIAEHFKTMRFQTSGTAEAIKLAGNGRAFANATAERDYRRYASAMARWQEWAGRGDLAFDTWLRLAILGDDEAWGRVLELQDDLMRKDDFALVLADRIGHSRHLDLEPLLAELLLDEGRTADAIAHLKACAARETNPLPVWLQLGRIYQQSGEWAAALDAFDRVLKLNARDVEARKGRAFCLVRMERYEEAGDAWLALSQEVTDDAEVQETCAALCDSLGREKEALEATSRLLACRSRQSMPDEHLDLASRFHERGDSRGELATLRDAMAKFPASRQLRYSLAESLAGNDENEEAAHLLADASLANDPESIDLLISVASELPEPPAGCELFNGKLPACLKALPVLQLRLALLFDQWGNHADSERIVASLQSDVSRRADAVWQELARISLDAGDTQRAELFASPQFHTVEAMDSRAWELVGDIYMAEERQEEAAAAYKKAVHTLLPSSSPARQPQQVTLARNPR